ncbi:MAG TPA: hypothetical protein VFQ60_02160 [Patescibacteria group bacterium]|nr:hypothetical protein [Patescibacteria group bacterium]
MSDLFSITDIRVQGTKALDATDVSREVYAILDSRSGWRPWPARHSWFIDTKKLSDELKQRLFAVSVVVDNSHLNILRLIIEERTNKLIFYSHQQYFWVDLQGIATAELSDAEKKDAQLKILGQHSYSANDPPIIHQDLDEQIAAGYVVNTSDQIKSWIQTASTISKNGLTFREIEPQSTSTAAIRVISSDGYPVLMDSALDIPAQVQAFLAFEKAKTTGLKVSEYVDVRIPGRIYIK